MDKFRPYRKKIGTRINELVLKSLHVINECSIAFKSIAIWMLFFNWFKYIGNEANEVCVRAVKFCMWQIYWKKKSVQLKTEAKPEKKIWKKKKINDSEMKRKKMNWNSVVILQQNWLINEMVREFANICISLFLITNTNFRAVSCTLVVPHFWR